MMKWACLFLFNVCLWSLSSAHSYANYSNLVNQVLTQYNPDIIPLENHKTSMMISVSGYLYMVMEVDVILGKISVLMSLIIEWPDSLIKWRPSDFGNLSQIQIPKSKVWTPAFIVSTPIDFKTLGEPWMPVQFSSDGSARLVLPDVVESGCKFNLKFWPFDRQICDISFAVFGVPGDQIDIEVTSNNVLHFGLLNENIEWSVEHAYLFARTYQGVSEAVLRVKIGRNSGFFVILIIFPLYGLACINSFVFLLPSDSGERIGFSTTMMLSITVFLEVISDYIPNTSSPLPLLCIVVTSGVSLSIICTLCVMLSLHFYHKDDVIPLPGILEKLVTLLDKKLKIRRVKFKRKHSMKVGNQVTSIDEYDVMKVRPCTENGTDESKEASGVSTKNRDSKVTWKDVSYTIDKVCFTVTIVVHGILTLSFTLYLTLGS